MPGIVIDLGGLMHKLVGGFVLVLLLALVLPITGCGSSSSTPLQEAEAEFREARDQLEEVEKGQEKKRNEALKAGSETEKLLNAQREAIVSGDTATYRELQGAAKEAQAKSEKLYAEAEALPENSQLQKQMEQAESEIERLKGCDSGCQRERKQAVAANTKCFVTLTRAEVPFEQASTICDKRYPIPRANILHLADE